MLQPTQHTDRFSANRGIGIGPFPNEPLYIRKRPLWVQISPLFIEPPGKYRYRFFVIG
jgi:hypothetical protein